MSDKKNLIIKNPLGNDCVRITPESLNTGKVEHCTLSPVKDGDPIHTEVLQLSPTGCPMVFESKTLFDPKEIQGKLGSSPGPGQVATPAYRSNYDDTFGGN